MQPDTPEPKVKVLIPMYKPLQVSKCEKCEKVIAEPKELISVVSTQDARAHIAERRTNFVKCVKV